MAPHLPPSWSRRCHLKAGSPPATLDQSPCSPWGDTTQQPPPDKRLQPPPRSRGGGSAVMPPPPAATSPPSRWLPSRLMRGLMKISGGPLLCSVQSGAGAALAGGMPWAGGEGAAGAWPRSMPTGGGLPGCPRLPSKHWQMGATSRVGERVGCDLPARERNIFTAVGGWVCTRLPSAARSPWGCCAHPARPRVSQPHSTHPWQ